ncbi:MAG: 1,4-dihydroxy-2-naphthoate octaprenyltransferase, partial [Gammaproteobacteria bacterium]|nr:1,4-dihydroxy-2-naphthoate octaprenyltransferase [Gammaproteobacteria bacterium]
NDAGDALRGADGPDRLGPKRAVAEGWLEIREVQRMALGCFLLAVAIGGYLVQVGGLPILLIGLFSVIAGISYTAGRLPIAYTGLGELFVFLFFGLLAVGGTAWLMHPAWSMTAGWLGSAIGLIAAAVLMVNNYRDMDTDRPAGKITLAIRLGREKSRRLYLGLLLLPFLPVLGVAYQLQKPGLIGVMLPALLMAIYLGRSIYRQPHGDGLNRLLVQTAQLQLLFAVLVIAGLNL